MGCYLRDDICLYFLYHNSAAGYYRVCSCLQIMFNWKCQLEVGARLFQDLWGSKRSHLTQLSSFIAQLQNFNSQLFTYQKWFTSESWILQNVRGSSQMCTWLVYCVDIACLILSSLKISINKGSPSQIRSFQTINFIDNYFCRLQTYNTLSEEVHFIMQVTNFQAKCSYSLQTTTVSLQIF